MRWRGVIFTACLLAGFASQSQAAPKAHVAQAKAKPAAGPDDTGEGFLNLYVGLCMKHLSDLGAMRGRLLRDKVPRLPPESAALFLGGMQGEAWPVPWQGKEGNFVLALPAGKNLCVLHARRTNAAEVERGFLQMVEQAPAPLVAKRGKNQEQVTKASGRNRTVSATWAQPGVRRKMQFILTTSSSSKAGRQAMASVAIVGEWDDQAP
jgi:hypothetical protein